MYFLNFIGLILVTLLDVLRAYTFILLALIHLGVVSILSLLYSCCLFFLILTELLF